MTSAGGSRKPVGLEDLIALNDEIASLVRAGVPLELGLGRLADDSGALDEVAGGLAARLNAGESLPQAISSEGRFPPLYRTVVEAGLRSGRLPSALEAVSDFARELVDLRRHIVGGLVYPLIVIVVAYVLFAVFVLELVTRFESAYETFRLPTGVGFGLLVAMRDTSQYWGWVPPALLAAAVVSWLFVARRRTSRMAGLPLIGARQLRYALFADLLAALVEHGVPLDEGLRLSAEATGDGDLQQAADELAAGVRAGKTIVPDHGGRDGLPPFLCWLISRNSQRGGLGESLRQGADNYRRRAARRLAFWKAFFPVAATVVIGGGATFLYALATFGPFVQMLNALGEIP